MAIRFMRLGRHKDPFYRIIAVDSRECGTILRFMSLPRGFLYLSPWRRKRAPSTLGILCASTATFAPPPPP